MTAAAAPEEPENNGVSLPLDHPENPGYWMEQVRQRALDRGAYNTVEVIKPEKCAMALEGLAHGTPMKRIAAKTGLDIRTVRDLRWRHKETLESRRKDMARRYGQAAEAAMDIGFKKIEMLEDDDEMLAATSLKDIALSSAIFVDKAMQLSGMATVTIEHRSGPSIEDAQKAIIAARQKIADKARDGAIDV